jgi:uncharacterized protein RhaS with RHS repeats
MAETTFSDFRRRLLFLATISLSSATAQAQSCDQLTSYLDDARMTFGQLRRDAAMDSTQALARQVRGELGGAAVAALSCRCQRTYIQLSTATAHARQAEEAATMSEAMDHFNRAVMAYNEALAALRICH